MATISFTASQLAYASASSWINGQARQGSYSGTRYQGAMRFSGLNGSTFSGASINKIEMKLTFMSAGAATSKGIGLYEAATDSISGAIGTLRGGEIGQVSSGGVAHNATRTMTFDSNTNSAMFTALKSYFTAGRQTLVLWRAASGDGSVGNYSGNYLAVSDAVLTFTYTHMGSTGTLGSTTVTIGNTAVFTIKANSATFGHRVTWIFGYYSLVSDYAPGVTNANTEIPIFWHNSIPYSNSGPATVILEAYDKTVGTAGANLISSVTYNLTLIAAEGVAPTFTSVSSSPVSESPVSGWSGVYVQGKSKANISINGAAGAYGAIIVSYSITTSPNIGSSTSSTLTTGYINTFGTITIKATITDSRGKSATKTTTINVLDYKAPMIDSILAFRSDINGVLNDIDGQFAVVRADFSVSSCGGKNLLTSSYVTIKRTDGVVVIPSWHLNSGVGVVLTSSPFELDRAYEVIFTAKDTIGTTSTRMALIQSAQYLMHFKRGGKALGFGKAAGQDNTISFGWPIELSAGLMPIGIPANTNLNTYILPGMYYCPLNSTAASLSNCPTGYAFSLWVGKHAGVHQMLFEYPINSPRMWVRNMSETSMWGAWVEVLTNRYLNTYTSGAQFGLTIDSATTMTQVFTALPNNCSLVLYTGGYANLRPPGGAWAYGFTTFIKSGGVYLAKYEGTWVNAGTLAYANINMNTLTFDGWNTIKQI